MPKLRSTLGRAFGRLQHQELVGRVQAGRAGLGWGEAPRFWSKGNQKERKEMVVSEVTRMEEERYKIKAVSQGRQGSWTTWDEVVDRKISWSDLGKIPQARLSFLIRSTYDTLPCPRNLHQWFGNEECCSLCKRSQRKPPAHLVRLQDHAFPGALLSSSLATTSLHPDIVVWSTKAKAVLLIELTVPWEKGIEAAFEGKKTKYSELAAECREAGWKTTIYPVEIGCRGFVGMSTTRLLRDAGVTGGKLKKATKELAEEVEKGSFWLWLRRKDKGWGKNT
ncbi:hypothetical protein SKAU_G00135970 [Synaphobranchus kaupii]|uniref:Uncharacterized protein n=1 Tax=Synaphobranchus kaupii TaxID=118154 RepID=A0A9Q1FRB5_SYNKA|nr:hypothetical protein SKAU_G00135970 [Synaphobranchus kaupii]